jgi:hypothetical protein
MAPICPWGQHFPFFYHTILSAARQNVRFFPEETDSDVKIFLLIFHSLQYLLQ